VIGVTEPRLPPSWDGSVVLDIGGEVGALVIRTPPSSNGDEIDLNPEDATMTTTHSAVRERRLRGGRLFAAVYPSLKAGAYVIDGSRQRVNIVGGQVTSVDYEIPLEWGR